MPAIHVEVMGRVQGVGFRWFVREAARDLGLAGWVRNLPGGQVEIAASGEEVAIERFRILLLRGPAGARVDSLRDAGASVESSQLPFPFSISR